MSVDATLRALLVDPSLFTAPYDAALTEGLMAAGVAPSWAIRPTRGGDREELAAEHVGLRFYGRLDGMQRAPAPLRAAAKGLAHIAGLVRLVRRAAESEADVVHFQWTVVPWLDTLAMRILRRSRPVVLTVHDTTPFNGESPNAWQTLAFDAPLRCADHLIVHTQSGRAELLRRGVPSERITVIPHGPLRLHAEPSERARERVDARYTFVLFGEIKRYKGLDVLVEALARLPLESRRAARVIVAGRPRIDLAPIHARIAELELGVHIEIDPRRLSEQEMADLFASADCFLFPYRQVDASGVYFLVKSCSKWIIASQLGIFAEDMVDGARGRLVPPEDVAALSQAMAHAIEQRPVPEAVPASAAWPSIGAATAALYRQALAAKEQQRGPAPRRSERRARVAQRAVASVLALVLLAMGVTAGAGVSWAVRSTSELTGVARVLAPAGRGACDGGPTPGSAPVSDDASAAPPTEPAPAERAGSSGSEPASGGAAGAASEPGPAGAAGSAATESGSAAGSPAAEPELPEAADPSANERPPAPATPAPVAPSAARRAIAPPLGLTDARYRLVQNWDFRGVIRDDAALRASFFTRYIYAGGTLDHLNDEWSRYRDADNHVFTAEGLALTARVRGPLAAGNVDSGMLRSRWSGKYGVFEIRMKPPAGRGLWPAFWLNPEDQVWPPEIDVIEIVDNGRDTPRQGFHFLHGLDEKKTPLFSRLNGDNAYAPGNDYTDAFHVFSVEWTPERVRHRVDGALVVDREFRWVHADGRDAGPAHVLVNLAVGGKWPGPPAAEALPARLVVDYIRVWQR